jgi:hypothetical protein
MIRRTLLVCAALFTLVAGAAVSHAAPVQYVLETPGVV